MNDYSQRIALTIREGAQTLGANEQTLRSLCARGAIPAHRIGGRWLIPTAHIRALGGDPMPAPDLNAQIALPVEKVSTMLPISAFTLRLLARNGDIPASRVGGQWMIPTSYLRMLASTT